MGNCIAANDKKKKMQLTLKTITWTRDSHGLFDFNSKSVVQAQLKVVSSGEIIRENSELKLVKSTDGYDSAEKLLSIKVNNDKISISANKNNQDPAIDSKKNDKEISDLYSCSDFSIWAIVKSFSHITDNKGYKLNVGDFIKLGRARLKVKELKASSDLNSDNKQSSQNKSCLKGINEKAIEEDCVQVGLHKCVTGTQLDNTLCRICLSDTYESDNPFIAPCTCAGTMKYIHIKCLQHWLNNKQIKKENNNCKTILWKNFQCELCMFNFPVSFKIDGKVYYAFEVEKPESNYIILEILAKNDNTVKGICVIDMNKTSVAKIGRGHDNDIRISDISVSRCHSLIKYDKGNFYLEDNDSKFGTLILIRSQFEISDWIHDLSILIGRSLLKFSIKYDRNFPKRISKSRKGDDICNNLSVIEPFDHNEDNKDLDDIMNNPSDDHDLDQDNIISNENNQENSNSNFSEDSHEDQDEDQNSNNENPDIQTNQNPITLEEPPIINADLSKNDISEQNLPN